MTPAEFVADIRAGKVQAMTGGLEGDALVSRMGKLDLSDLEAVTAEAFNQGVTFPSGTDWDAALVEITAAASAEKELSRLAVQMSENARLIQEH